jgi:hypothetical protein
MSGYTPVFDTVFNGTLCGKWPALPVWLTILPLADWRGHIDLTPQAISLRTGWPMELLMQGLHELCAPDPQSRSREHEGRRLVPIDSDRGWGWRVVNIQLYRDKASQMSQINDGRNAEKVKRYKERHRKTPEDTAGHLQTPTHTHTHTHTHTKTQNQNQNQRAIKSLSSEKTQESAMEDRTVPRCPPDSPSHTHTQTQTKIQNQRERRSLKTLSESVTEKIPEFSNLVRKLTA